MSENEIDKIIEDQDGDTEEVEEIEEEDYITRRLGAKAERNKQ
jgi:hypothetical protein